LKFLIFGNNFWQIVEFLAKIQILFTKIFTQ